MRSVRLVRGSEASEVSAGVRSVEASAHPGGSEVSEVSAAAAAAIGRLQVVRLRSIPRQHWLPWHAACMHSASHGRTQQGGQGAWSGGCRPGASQHTARG